MRVSTNWLKEFVTLPPPLETLAGRLTMAGLEVKNIQALPDLEDTVFEIEITTNRPDWLSHLGVAREIRALENKGMKIPPSDNPGTRPMPSGWKITPKELNGCPYYTACLLEGVEQQETPEWMRKRLEACGVRPVSLIVDITNYVLLETGQPLHAFDADLLQGKEIQIRRAKPGETFTAIDGKKYELVADDLVIADRDKAIALAGVMGGKDTEVTTRTRNIILESAFFTPRWVRKTSLRHGLVSDSSYRFERRVDPEGVDWGRERAVRLLRELSKARYVSAVLKTGSKPALAKSKVHLSLEQVKKVLGMELKASQIHSALLRLGLDLKNENPETWVVGIPSYRCDLESSVDLIEEVARITGYDSIPESLPVRPPAELNVSPLRDLEESTRNFLAGTGLFETVTFSLIDPKRWEETGADSKNSLPVHNPIHRDLTLLRPGFLPSLLEVQSRNERAGERSIPIFEIANLYSKSIEGPGASETKSVGILVAGQRPAGWNDPKRELNFFDLKGVVEAYAEVFHLEGLSFERVSLPFLENGAQVILKGEKAGYLGKVAAKAASGWDLRLPSYYAELSLEKVLRSRKPGKKFQAIARYPAVERDLSIVVEEAVKCEAVLEEIKRAGGELVAKAELFDLFRGGRIPAGQKNMAFRVTYQSSDKTLLSEEIQNLHTSVGNTVAKKYHAHFQQK